jgi:acyl phosphate:glycerol-3-phosphate acyltransferase
MTELLVKGVLAYLVGSIIGSLLIARLTGGVDIRTLGSGNAGATNALRIVGRKVAVWVLLIDVAKGWIATRWLAPWSIPGIAPALPELEAWCVPVCGVAVMLGHVYPVWFGFRGGKGFATLLGAVLGISPSLLLPMILTWLITVILLGFVGLASILSAVALATWIAVTNSGAPLLTFGILSTVLMAFTHRSNIARMRTGTEPRARRLWLFGTRRGPG